MSEPRRKRLQSGGAMIVCAFTYGDGHVCDQPLGIGRWIETQVIGHDAVAAGRDQLLEVPTGPNPFAGVIERLLAAAPRDRRPGYEGDVQPPRGWYYTPAVDGIHEMRRRKGATPRRPMPEALQPKDDNDQPMWPLTRWGMPTGLTAKHIIGADLHLPDRVRCPKCRQVRTLTPERSGV